MPRQAGLDAPGTLHHVRQIWGRSAEFFLNYIIEQDPIVTSPFLDWKGG